jgi:transcriptional regulator with XRE-family HTH domain
VLDTQRIALCSVSVANSDQAAEAWSRYVRHVAGNLTAKEVAARTSISESTVGNWLRGEHFTRPDLWRVRDFALVFKRPVPEALIAAGFDESDFGGTIPPKPDPSALTADELLAELRRRVPDQPQPTYDHVMTGKRSGENRVNQDADERLHKALEALVLLLESSGYHIDRTTEPQ